MLQTISTGAVYNGEHELEEQRGQDVGEAEEADALRAGFPVI